MGNLVKSKAASDMTRGTRGAANVCICMLKYVYIYATSKRGQVMGDMVKIRRMGLAELQQVNTYADVC